jgi:transcriptional adapter 2-alpha
MNEKKRTKEERDVVNKIKVFARLQTREQHEAFIDGLLCASFSVSHVFELTMSLDEMALRKRISELQEYRKAGLTSISEVDRYERDKNAKVGRLAVFLRY